MTTGMCEVHRCKQRASSIREVLQGVLILVCEYHKRKDTTAIMGPLRQNSFKEKLRRSPRSQTTVKEKDNEQKR